MQTLALLIIQSGLESLQNELPTFYEYDERQVRGKEADNDDTGPDYDRTAATALSSAAVLAFSTT